MSFADPVLGRLLLQPELISRTTVEAHHDIDISSVYHIDQGRHFVGVMLLLADLTE